MTDWSTLRVGYGPCSADLSAPGDRRRFAFWAAARGVRIRPLEPGGSYDLVVLSSRADIVHWRHADRDLPIVYDLIDSYLALPRWSARSMLRGPAKFASRETRALVVDYHGAIEDMCRRADVIVCSTQEQQAVLRQLNDEVHIVLDAHGEVDGPVKQDFHIGDRLNVVWEGLPHTLGALASLRPVLDELAADRPVDLHLVTDPEFAEYAGRFRHRITHRVARRIYPNVYVHGWHPMALAAIATAADVAVIPLDLSDPFSRGKPENKLLLLWRMGVPTVTSASPAYRRTMAAAGIDLACETPAEWSTTLHRLLADEQERADSSQRGIDFVRRHHAPEQLLERWDRVIAAALRR